MQARRGAVLVAYPDPAKTPAVPVPEAPATPGAGGTFSQYTGTAIGRAAGGDSTADDRTTDQSGRHARGYAALCARGCRCERAGYSCGRDQGSKCLLHVLDSPGGGAFGLRRGLKMT